jgi:hypothetical protein
MDACAELTLRIIRLAQEHDNLTRTSVDWHFFPGERHAPWAAARDILSATAKPAIVAALVEPGALAVWSVGEMHPPERESCERAFANQIAYFGEKLRLLGLDDGGSIALTTPAGEFTMTVADFRRWMSEYAISVGVSLDRSSVPGTGRILVRPPGGGRRPIGMEAADAPLERRR